MSRIKNNAPVLTPWIFTILCGAVILFGIGLRFIHIAQNDFIFYDEGMYLEHNRELLDKIAAFPPKDFAEFLAIQKILFYTALMTAKWLWFYISNLRVFAGGPEMFYFTRIVSALCGVLTVFLAYIFARRYFKSRETAVLAAAILAVLPSHVFYSRLGMQESLSTLCLLAGMYFYFSTRAFGFRTIAAAILFSAVFFTNYRMIVLPVLLIAAEGMSSLGEKKSIHWTRLGGALLVFAGIVFWIGSLNNGSNRYITFAWMSHQAADAPQQWHLINIFSYPYGIFSLEGALFALALLLNVYWIYRREWAKVLPFTLVIVQMGIFTLAAEKGARYLCVVLPFAAMAAAAAFNELVLNHERVKRLRWAPILLCALFIFSMAEKSWALAQSNSSGYRSALNFIQARDPQAKFLTTQPVVVGLFLPKGDAQPAPKTVRDLIIFYAQGYRYLMIDPQAYVSWTANGARFTPALADYLEFVRDHMKPLYVADHLNHTVLQRFVLDHNENLMNSVRFLNIRTRDFGAVYVYDLKECLATMQKVAQSSHENLQ